MFKPNETSLGLKALAMLDHVMLWVARGFTAFAALFGIGVFWEQGLGKGDIIFSGSVLTATVAWVICTWSLNHRSSRLFLGISSLIFLVGFLKFATYEVRYESGEIKFWIAPIIGSIAMRWVSLRSPSRIQYSVNPVLKFR